MVAYLCTGVSKSTNDDWKKLRCLHAFLKHTINDVRVIGANSLQELYTWIDAAYGVHNADTKSHTGGTMSMGIGTMHQTSSKQKLNVNSVTEAEIVGSSEYVPYNVWLRNFMEAQGYKLEDNILFQDNQIAIRMQVNGRRSCTGNSHHIRIRYCFVKDLIDKKKIRVIYCPTGLMWANFLLSPYEASCFDSFVALLWDGLRF